MEYRQTADALLSTLQAWDELIPGKGKIRLIACGGTALTLLGYKESTKDVDFLIPEIAEHERLTRFLQNAGYAQVGGYKWRRKGEFLEFDLFPGSRVFMTELMRSPLEKGGHRLIREFDKIHLGVLNSFDWLITKLARGSEADYQDCLALLRNEKVDWPKFSDFYAEAAKYSINFGIEEDKARKNLELLEMRMKKEGIYDSAHKK